jgi:hypothetical protein
VVPPSAPSKVSYWIEAIDARGSPVATWRSARDPLKVEIEDEVATAGPIYKRAWFWAAAGVVVAGAATAIVFAATQEPVYRVQLQPPP